MTKNSWSVDITVQVARDDTVDGLRSVDMTKFIVGLLFLFTTHIELHEDREVVGRTPEV